MMPNKINYFHYEGSEYPLNGAGDTLVDYHATNTIQLCELLDAGFPLIDEYNQHDANLERVTKLAIRRYYYREIAGAPWKFKQNFNRILAEEMNRLAPMYRLLDNDKMNFEQGATVEHKERNIHSDYPQSQIQTNGQDYASSADDHEFKDVTTPSNIELVERFTALLQQYDSLDMRIVDALAVCFNPFVTSFINY